MFQFVPLSYPPFAPLFALDDAALVQHCARRVIAGDGAPCRVSLDDAVPGETLLLINYVHQPAANPYHAMHAIFVREARWRHGLRRTRSRPRSRDARCRCVDSMPMMR